MCKDVDLSQTYTNHCTRATASKLLSDAAFDRSDIIKITGHRDTRSLDTYIGAASSSKKRALSSALSSITCEEKRKSNVALIRDKMQAERRNEIRHEILHNIQEHSPGQLRNSEIRNEMQHNIPEHSPGQVGNSDHITLTIADDDMTVYKEKDFEEQRTDDYKLNMIKSARAVDICESKRSIGFNSCISMKSR